MPLSMDAKRDACEISSSLGAGGMRQVYRAPHTLIRPSGSPANGLVPTRKGAHATIAPSDSRWRPIQSAWERSFITRVEPVDAHAHHSPVLLEQSPP